MIKLNVPRFKQTPMMCGPYALQQIFVYFGDDTDVKELIKKAKARKNIGTFFSQLLCIAEQRGFKISFYTNNLRTFDLSWKNLSSNEIAGKLKQRSKYKKNEKTNYNGFINYFKKGGKVHFRPITKELIISLLDKKIPIFACLSTTFFYKNKREKGIENFDDIKGDSQGHFLVIAGYNSDKFYVVDPGLRSGKKTGKYWVDQDRLVTSLLIWSQFIAGTWK